MWMVTEYSGKHWCSEPQIFATYRLAAERAREASGNGKSSLRIWKMEAHTTVETTVRVERNT